MATTNGWLWNPYYGYGASTYSSSETFYSTYNITTTATRSPPEGQLETGMTDSEFEEAVQNLLFGADTKGVVSNV